MAHSGARGGVEQIRQLGRHARSDGQAVGPDHRDADQVELPRRAERAGVLLDARCPQGPGRHGPEDGRLRLPDPQARRRGPERRHHDARLRHHAGHHQGHHLQGRRDRPAAWPTSIRGRVSRNPIAIRNRRGDRRRERDDHAGQGQEDRAARHRQGRSSAAR